MTTLIRSQLPVVIDKSFLQGASQIQMHEVGKSHRLLMSEALLYELLSNPLDYRACFCKFPVVDNPVILVPHVGGYLKKEIEGRRPAPKPSNHTSPVKFRFNPQLLEGDYALPKEAAAEIQRQQTELLADVKTLKDRALLTPEFFPDVFAKGSDGTRKGAKVRAEALIAAPGSLLDFYAQLRAPKGMKRFPPKKMLTADWAIYRWLQVQFLFSLDLYLRYGATLAEAMSPATEAKIEHDVLDAQYLFIGVLEGAFATEERKLQRWFKLLQPNGQLLRLDARPVQ